MGQLIEVSSRVVGDVALFDTDRSITGQDGATYTEAPAEEPAADDFAAQLARRLFAAEDAISSVFVASNTVSVKREAGWGQAEVDRVADEIRRFFVHYADADRGDDSLDDELVAGTVEGDQL